MKISEMNTDRALDVLVEITPYVNKILSDTDLIDKLKSTVAGDKELTKAQMIAIGIEKINSLVPIVLHKHRGDVYGVLSAVNEIPVDDIQKQNFFKTFYQIREVVGDKELMGFFRSFAHTEKKQ